MKLYLVFRTETFYDNLIVRQRYAYTFASIFVESKISWFTLVTMFPSDSKLAHTLAILSAL